MGELPIAGKEVPVLEGNMRGPRGGQTWYGCLCSQCPAADCPEELILGRGCLGSQG